MHFHCVMMNANINGLLNDDDDAGSYRSDVEQQQRSINSIACTLARTRTPHAAHTFRVNRNVRFTHVLDCSAASCSTRSRVLQRNTFGPHQYYIIATTHPPRSSSRQQQHSRRSIQ